LGRSHIQQQRCYCSSGVVLRHRAAAAAIGVARGLQWVHPQGGEKIFCVSAGWLRLEVYLVFRRYFEGDD